MSDAEKCDQEVFEQGDSLLAIDGWAKDIEPWVQALAKKSGQRVDWHYSGGIANVLVLGDFNKALQTAKELEPQLVWVEPDANWYKQRGMDPNRKEKRNPTIMRWYSGKGDGLYRAGDPVPPGAIAIDTTGSL